MTTTEKSLQTENERLRKLLDLARRVLVRPLPATVTLDVIKNRLGAYNAIRKKAGESRLEIEEYLEKVFWPRHEKQEGPKTKPKRKNGSLSISPDALADLAQNEGDARELELQKEVAVARADFEALNKERTRKGLVQLTWHTYCRDREIGIYRKD